MRKGADFHPPPFYVYGSSVKYGVFQDCGGLLFRLHLHIQKLRNMTGVISETTEKIILYMKVTKQADIFA